MLADTSLFSSNTHL
uniref:Uncharacterized protein n=1 Tax=Arundo donax TaxID=35708 RepID=A0A0A9AP21_ARUDO